ncbi:MAG: gamma-glutamylcyclotransferase family protein [Opitutales bacterium]
MNFSELSVFVYGTLKPGGHYWPEYCEGKVSSQVPAKVQGELYDLHVGYPGLWLGGPGHSGDCGLPSKTWVQGFILSFMHEQDFLRLDHLEGYEPGRPDSDNEYIRQKVHAYSIEGEKLGDVWAYEMTKATMQRHKATRLEDGNWPIL